MISYLLGHPSFLVRLKTARILRYLLFLHPLLYYGYADYPDAEVRKAVREIISPAFYVSDYSYRVLLGRPVPHTVRQTPDYDHESISRLIQWSGVVKSHEYVYYWDHEYLYDVNIPELRKRIRDAR